MERRSPSSLNELDMDSGEGPEEMATASLIDVMSQRNRFLEEKELWALCRECCLTLEYVHDCHDLFQSLCISPETVAFDQEGNVCFLDLDVEPESTYIAPEYTDYGKKSYKSHLFSLGMTLLYATQYNMANINPQAALSDTFSGLLTSMTRHNADDRPDMDAVITACEAALGQESSQEICLKIIDFQSCTSSECKVIDEASKDLNDNCLQKMTANLDVTADTNLLRNGPEEFQNVQDEAETTFRDQQDKQSQGIVLSDILNSLERSLDEVELWSLCRESVLSLQKKRKHFPAYISLDTVILEDTGTISFNTTPKDKPLEVIYMAPELQKKGVLDDKTCLYGLGITLRSAAGLKYSSSFSIPDGEALEILITSFTQGHPDKRPDLNTALEMCEEYEKVSKTSSQQVCHQLYKETMKAIDFLNGQNKENITQMSSENGGFTEHEPSRHPVLTTDVGLCSNDENTKSAVETGGINVSSAFKQVAAKSKPVKDLSRLPSAFSSPATHFKPIILQNAEEKFTNSGQQSSTKSSSDKESQIVSKLKDIKHSLLKHRNPESLNKSVKESKGIAAQNNQISKDSGNLEQTLYQHQSHLPNTDVLASVLAHYLANYLTDSAAKQSHVPNAHTQGLSKSILPTSSDSGVTESSTQTLNGEPPFSVQSQHASQMNYLPQQNINQSFHNIQQSSKILTAASGTGVPIQQMSLSLPNNIFSIQENMPNISSSHRGIQNSSFNNQGNATPIAQTSNTFPYSMSTAAVMNQGHQYSAPFSGLSPGNLPVQYTLVQDPVTGLVQMLPAPYVSISNTHPSQGIPATHGYLPGMSVNVIPTSRAGLYNPAHSEVDQSYRNSEVHNPANISSGKLTSWSKRYSDTSTSHSDALARSSEKFTSDQSQLLNLRTGSHEKGEGESIGLQFISDSPSKDSGISPSLQPGSVPFSSEILTERQRVSVNSDRHKTYCNVVRIVQEAYTRDGFNGAGVEDHVIAEYIMSLSCLTYETFCNAVREKFFHFLWSHDILDMLFEAIGGHKFIEYEYIAQNKPLHGSNIKTRKTDSNNQLANKAGRHLPTCYDHVQGRDQLPNQYKKNRHERQQLPIQHQQNSQKQHQVSSHHYPNQATAASTFQSRKPQLSRTNSRPKSEIRKKKGFWSEASDSTDSEARGRNQHFRQHYEPDKAKSLSTHNLSLCDIALAPYEYAGPEASGSVDSDSLHSVSRNQNKTISSKNINKPGSSKLYHDHMSENIERKSTSSQSDKFSVNSSISSHNKTTVTDHAHPDFVGKHDRYSSPPTSLASHSSSSKSGSSRDRKHSSIPCSHEVMTHSHETMSASNQTSHHSQNTTDSNHISGNSLSQPQHTHSSHCFSSDFPVKKDYSNLSSSKTSIQQQTKINNPHQQPSAYGQDNVSLSLNHPVSDSEHNIRNQSTPTNNNRFSTEPERPPRNNMPLEYHKPHWTKQNVSSFQDSHNSTRHHATDFSSDSSFSSSAEVRKLASQNPALYTDRHPSGVSAIHDKDMQIKSDSTSCCQNLQNNPKHTADSWNIETSVSLSRTRCSIQNSHPDMLVPHNRHNDMSKPGPDTGPDNFSAPTSHMDYEHAQPELRNQNGKINNSRTSTYGGRSFSAVYSQQAHQPETGVTVFNPSESNVNPEMQHRRQSDGSIQLPEINNVLLPFVKKGSVVYHSAMVQLSYTAEVDAFIHSIDEENKPVIEHQLASISQEIAMHRRQRQKTQKLYKKLSDQNAAGKKGDQNVSEQMLKDMTDMTKRMSFLQLCQVHLKMLLAELNGLDSSLLYSLSNSEGVSSLTLIHVTSNPYLQFRTLTTSETEQMTVLQAGTPRGLMSYLYTLSALSNGYIHQFLLCFRYILTADQLLTFIMEKYLSALRSNQKDTNVICIQRRSMDLLHFWIEGYYSVDFAPNKGLIKKMSDFLTDQTNANGENTSNLLRMIAACRKGENSELMHMTNMDDDDTEEGIYFFHLINPKRWESFRSLLRRSKSSLNSSGSFGKSRSHSKALLSGSGKPSSQFSLLDCSAHALAEQLTLLEQELFQKCHPIHFLNSQFQGVGVALSMPGLRTPSMSRKSETSQGPKKGLFVGDPVIESYVVHMINHAQELAHWVSAEILSCGSNKTQTDVITKFVTTAHLCQEVRNFASALSVLDGLENLVVKQLPVWKNIPAKALAHMDELTSMKMKLKSEALWLMSEKDCHIYPTIPCALYAALHLQQIEIGSFTLANGMYKWDKIRSITETVDQIRIFRDHAYGFQPDIDIQRALRRRLSEYSEKDLHAVASTQDNNFRRHSSTSSLSGTLKKVKDILKKKT